MSNPSPPSSGASTHAVHGYRDQRSNFAFLVHSQETLPRNLPPNVDNKSLARQRRRRTSPEDQAILEAEYRRNPKPDKAARMDIVSRVALGEKEVQIWFQNRRQNTRRKSRPLLPHEISSVLASNYMQSKSSDAEPSSDISRDDQLDDARGSQNSTDSSDQQRPGSEGSQTSRSSIQESVTTSSSPQSIEFSQASSIYQSSSQTVNTESQDPHIDGHAPIGGFTCFSRIPSRRSISFTGDFPLSSQDDTYSRPFSSQSSDVDALVGNSSLGGNRPLKRASSFVRLSMSLDGKAEVITNDGASPPRCQSTRPAQPMARAALGRSRSAVGFGDISKHGPGKLPPAWQNRITSGRSRSARTWEFYCDSDVREALSAKAEQDQSGSAVGAIGLLRSRCSNFLANTNKRFSQDLNLGPAKRPKASGGRPSRPKLTRASSSLARLQSNNSDTKKQCISTKPRKITSQKSAFGTSGDSDKENWVPGTQHPGSQRRQPSKVQHARRSILGENHSIPSHMNSFKTLMDRETLKGVVSVKAVVPEGDDKENNGSASGDSEVSRNEDDLDCVQNLLSLSQGNWR